MGLGFLASSGHAVERESLDDPFEITADRIDYDGRRSLYVATGNVHVLQTTRKLTARWVAFSTDSQVGVAEGDVVLIDGESELHAEFMVFDVDTLQGTLFQGSLDAGSDSFRIRAEELVRTGKNTFTARDAVFTTCQCEPGKRLPWELHAGEADVEMGGYGTIKNSTFDVLGVPVLWIPWAFFPVKSERETGLLLPTFQLGGRSGYGGGLPFFWAVHPQVNVTATPTFLTERGYKQDVEVEYVFGKESEGTLFVSGLSDQFNDTTEATNEARWGVLWDHDQTLPGDWRWQTDLNLSSDNFYSDDFDEFRDYKQFRFIESTSNVARDFGDSGGYGAMIATRYADDVQGLTVNGGTPDASFADTDDFLLQRFAEVRGDVQPGTIVAPFGVEARLDAEAIYFSGLRNHENIFVDQGAPRVTNNGHFYDIGVDSVLGNFPSPGFGENDGIFEPGEAIAERGARVVLHPRLARVFTINRIAEFVPEIGWSQTLYKTDEEQFAERGFITGRADLRTRLERDYVDETGSALRHVIEPRLTWAFVSERDQDRNPLFVPVDIVSQSRLRALSLDNVTRSPSDRIDAANQFVLGVGQRFFTRRRAGGATRLQGELLTAINWDLEDGGLGNVFIEGRIFQLGPFGAQIRGAFDPEAVAIDEEQTEITYNHRFSNAWILALSLAANHRYLRRLPVFFDSNRGGGAVGKEDQVNQFNLLFSIQVTDHLRLRYSTVYKLAGENEFIKNEGMFEYASKCRCWGLGVSVFYDRRDGVGAGLTIRILGLGDEGGDLFSGGFGTGMNL